MSLKILIFSSISYSMLLAVEFLGEATLLLMTFDSFFRIKAST